MEFSFQQGRNQASRFSKDYGNSSSDGISSDRLKRAIERNRAKQASRASREAKLAGMQAAAGSNSTPLRRRSSSLGARTSSLSSRRGVASAENVEFTQALRRPPRKAPATVKYTTSQRVRRSTTTKGPMAEKMQRYLVRIGWALAFFLILRLIFTNGGVMDFYSQKSHLASKNHELELIIEENKQLLAEIEKIEHNKSYQRKIVRDNLGFIAQDEFLILFAKDK